MGTEDTRPWPELPRECLEMIVHRGGPQAAASLSSTCKSWRSDISDETIWRSWHGLPLLRYRTWQGSFGIYAHSLRSWLAGLEQATTVVPHAHERWLASLDLSPTHVLSGSLDANVKYWDRSRPGTWVHYLRGHTGPVSSVRLACDGAGSCTSAASSSYSRAYSGSRDGTLRCWDLRTGTCVRAYTLEGGRQWVNTVAVWRPQQQQHLQQLLQRAAGPSNAAGPGGPLAGAGGAVGDGDGGWRNAGLGLFGAMGGAAHGAIGAASPWASSPSAEPPAAGPMAVVCGTSIGQLCLYDVRQSVLAQRLNLQQQQTGPPPGAVYGVACYGDALAAACASGSIFVWDLRAGAVRHKLDEHGSACTCVAMYGDSLVAGDLEGSVYLWSTREEAGGRRRFRGAMAPAAAARQRPQCAAGSDVSGSASQGAAARVPAGLRWPAWRPHRRRPGLYGHGSDSDGNGSSSDDEEGGPGCQRGRGGCFDGAATVAALQALSDGRAAARLPYGCRQPPPPPPGSPWLQGRLAAAGAVEGPADAASVGEAAAGGTAGESGTAPPAAPPPRLRAVMRHTEWVRDVALVGPTLVLSCSKDGLVCLSRTDTMQVIAVWDVAATTVSGARSDDAATGSGWGGGPHVLAGDGALGVRGVQRSGALETCDSGGGGSGQVVGVGQVVNQVHALAADEWGFVAGCQDASMRAWSFAPGGVLPELWTPAGGVGRGSACMGNLLLSDMRGLSC